MGDGFWIGALRNFGIFRAVGDVRAKAAVKHLDAVTKVSDIFLGFGLEFGGVEFAGFFQRDGVRIFRFDGDEEFADLDVWTKAADVGFDVLPVFSLTNDAR